MIKFLYLVAAILALIAAFVHSEQGVFYAILACINVVLFKMQCIEEDLL